MSTGLPQPYAGRVRALRAALREHDPPLDGLLVSSAANRRYLSGFTGSAGWLLVTSEAAVLLVDSRYVQQAAEEAPGWQVVQLGPAGWEELAQALRQHGVRCAGLEREHVTLGQWERLRQRIPDVEWVPAAPLVEPLRAVKDPQELARIRRAAQVADRAFQEVLPELRPGRTEQDIALELEVRMRRLGAEAAAFPPIVASGPRSALPHARAGARRLQPGDVVVLDFGAVVDGYCSDCTRVAVLGRADPELRRLYRLVREAQAAALAALRPGASGREVDAAARAVLEEAGLGERFGHGTGHGVGLEVHEAPRLGRTSEDVLKAGMVTTVEPGVYLPGWGGIRIEDLVAVREEGYEVLTQAPRELLEL